MECSIRIIDIIPCAVIMGAAQYTGCKRFYTGERNHTMQNILEQSMQYLAQFDAEVAASMEREYARQKRNIELIASENVASMAVIAAMGSVLTNKYAEGYPGKRYYGGCEFVDEVETLAIERAKALFGAAYANVQPHSGAQANLAAYAAMMQPGDTLLGMDLANGGHLTHGAKVNLSGKYYNSVSYGVDNESGCIDFNLIEDLVKQHQPKVVVAGASAYPRAIDFKTFADIAHRYGAYLMVDMAHIAGLVAGGQHMNPVPYADVVTTTTHKTLRGPRGGMILTNDEALAKKINSAVFPGSQGGPLMHVIAGKAVCLKEAASPAFAQYAKDVVTNAAALAESLRAHGFDMVSGGTDNHLVLVDLRRKGVTGKELQDKLDSVNITLNKNAIPNDPQKPGITSGVRIGTPVVTTRGFVADEMEEIVACIDDIVTDYEGNKAAVTERVAEIIEKHPIY